MPLSEAIPASAPHRSGPILVVDDDAVIRSLIVDLLQGEGYQVVGAIDGLDALAMLDRVRPRLVVSDVVMPRLGGVELRDAMRQRNVLTPVLLMSAMGQPTTIDRSRFMNKPFDIDTLLAKVDELLALDGQ